MKSIQTFSLCILLLCVNGYGMNLRQSTRRVLPESNVGENEFADDKSQLILLDVDNNLDRLEEEFSKTNSNGKLTGSAKQLWAGFKKNMKDEKNRALVADKFNTALKLTVSAFEDDDPAAGIGAILNFGGVVGSIVPGGQPFALVLGLLGTIVGLFSPSSSKAALAPQITIDQIKVAVRSELWEHDLVNFQDIKLPAIGTELLSQVTYMMDVMNSTSANASNAIDNYMQDWFHVYANILSDSVKMTQEGWNFYKKTLREYAAKDPTQRRCVNTCFLMVSPLEEWKKNPNNPDYSRLTTPDWDVTKHGDAENAFSEAEEDVRFKLCYFHYTHRDSFGITHYHNYLNQYCKKRVYNIDTCSKQVQSTNTDFDSLKGLHNILESITHLQIVSVTILQRLLLLSEKRDRQAQKSIIQGLSTLISSGVWNTFTWDFEAINRFELNGQNYSCTDKSYKWLSQAGDTGYENNRLKDAPCAYRSFCSGTSDDMAVCNDEQYHCQDFDHGDFEYGPSTTINYDWIGPTYSYDKAIGKPYDGIQQLDILSALYAVPA